MDQGREKNEAVGDVLGFFGQVLADECIVKAKLVGQDDGLAVFLQRLRGRTVRRMHGHREITKSHEYVPLFGSAHCAKPDNNMKTMVRTARLASPAISA